MLKECIVGDWARWQDSNAIIQTLINLIENLLVDCLGDLVSDKAFPFKEPVRANHIPMVAVLPTISVCTIQLYFQDHLFFNPTTKFERIDLISRDFIWSVKYVIVCFKWAERLAKLTLNLFDAELCTTCDTIP